jgi:hypothetical protein
MLILAAIKNLRYMQSTNGGHEMSQPTPYTPEYDFSAFSSGSPNSQPPGVPLDVEFDNLRITIAAILNNLALIQRDDTALRNTSVGVDQLTPSAVALIGSGAFTLGGTWTTGLNYTAGQFVSLSGITYLVMQDHAAGTIAADIAADRLTIAFDPNQRSRKRDSFVGDAVTTDWTLSQEPIRDSDLEVYIDGVLQLSSAYTTSGVTLTLAPAQGATKKIEAFTTSSAAMEPLTQAQIVYAVNAASANAVKGDSAYQLWLNEGNSGTEAAFLESLIGSSNAADTTALLLATTRAFDEGDTINTANGYAYLVAASAATDHHLTTAGGVKLYLLPAGDGRYHTRGFGIEPSANNKAQFTAFFAAFGGKPVLINYAAGQYRANYIVIQSNTNIMIESGVYIKGLDAGEATIFRTSQDASDFVISGYGATIELPASDISHALNFGASPKRVLVEGLTIIGPGLPNIHESDCIYIGGQPDDDNVSEDIIFRDVVARNSRRNILSIVACHNFLAENCSFSGTLVGGTLRKVIDIEANRWMANGDFANKGLVFRRCKIFDGVDDGILKDFGTDVLIDDCDIYDCAQHGIHVKPGTHMFTTDRNERVGDSWGVISIDSATGWITVSTSAKLTDDYGIRPGMYCTNPTRNGGAWPTEMNGGFYIEDISLDQLKMRVSLDWGSVVTTTTGSGSAGTGSFSEDFTVSSLYINVYRMNESVTIKNTRVYDCAENSLELIGSYMDVDNCEIYPPAARTGVNVLRSTWASVSNCKIYGANLSARGISFQGCTGAQTFNNKIEGMTDEGISVVGSSGARLLNDKITDCGLDSNSEPQIWVDKSKRVVIDGAVMRSSLARPSKYGIRTGSAAVNLLVTGVDAFSCGSNNSTSISIAVGTGNRIVQCILRDGTWSV